jgi:hypothetical protein
MINIHLIPFTVNERIAQVNLYNIFLCIRRNSVLNAKSQLDKLVTTFIQVS